jgi:hypothetical protein
MSEQMAVGVAIAMGWALAPASVRASHDWNADSDGNWSDATKWDGGVPDGTLDRADIHANITATRTITLDSDRTVGGLGFSDGGAAGESWILAGPGKLTLSGGGASSQGSLTIVSALTPVEISAQLVVSTQIVAFDGGDSVISVTGNNTYAAITFVSTGVLRAEDGTGLPAASNLAFTSSNFTGVFESKGSFTRRLGTGQGQVQWNHGGYGGFSAAGGPLTVNLTNAAGTPGGLLTWGAGSFVTGALLLGSPTADNVVTFQNAIALGTGAKTIVAIDNPFSEADRAVVTGSITGAAILNKTGYGVLEIRSGTNSYGDTSFNQGTLLLNNTSGSATGPGAVNVYNGLTTLGGTGFIVTANKPVTFTNASRLSPGDIGQVGTLSANTGTAAFDLSDVLSVANSQTMLFDLNSPLTSDQLKLLGGSANIGSAKLEFDDFVFTPKAGFGAGTYTLIDGVNPITGSLGANLTGEIDGNSATLSLSDGGNDLILTVSPVPEPSTAAILFALAPLRLARRRRE